jgi:hypothetical protein
MGSTLHHRQFQELCSLNSKGNCLLAALMSKAGGGLGFPALATEKNRKDGARCIWGEPSRVHCRYNSHRESGCSYEYKTLAAA